MFQTDYQSLEIILLKYISSICLFGRGVILKKLTSTRKGEEVNKKRTGGEDVKMTQNGLTSTSNGPVSKLH